MNTQLNTVDLCFVVDTTGSIGPFIEQAKRHLVEAMARLAASGDYDLRVGLVEYRDHPPQDPSFVTRLTPLTHDLGAVRRVVDEMFAAGGGDRPEAVYDGVRAACLDAGWRETSVRVALLVGDAPPHGFVAGRPDASGACRCGLTLDGVTSVAETRRVVVHAITLGGAPDTFEAFTRIAAATGGRSVASAQADRAIAAVENLVASELRALDLDTAVLAALDESRNEDATVLAAAAGCTPLQAASAVARLGKRGFLRSAH